jgi:transcriptional regulator with XRE-family HTH domain
MTALLEPEPDPVALRGCVLRAWREHAGMSGAELARALPAQRSTVSMWEADGRSRRAATLEIVHDIARCLGLSAAHSITMADLWRAASSIADGLPRRDWSFNFDGPSGPAWLWLRGAPATQSPRSRMSAELWWGEPFQASIDVEGSSGGVVVTLPTTLRNPALAVRLARPGWADVGRGSIPAGVSGRLGTQVVDGASLLEPAPQDRGRFQTALTPLPTGYAGLLRRVFEEFGIGWRVLRPHAHVAHVERAPAGTVASGPPCGDARFDDAQTRLSMPADQLCRVRQARGRSRQSVADQAGRLDPANPVPAKAIEMLETAGRIPPITGLVARIDLVLALDGRLGVERTFDSRESCLGRTRTRHLVPFPRYWVGPVWLRAIDPEGDATGAIDLRWGPWRRRQTVRSGVVLDFRRAPSATAPLEVIVPVGWRVTAGIGRWPDALDVNRDWWPADVSAAIGLLRGALSEIRAGQMNVDSAEHAGSGDAAVPHRCRATP